MAQQTIFRENKEAVNLTSPWRPLGKIKSALKKLNKLTSRVFLTAPAADPTCCPTVPAADPTWFPTSPKSLDTRPITSVDFALATATAELVTWVQQQFPD